MNPNQTPEQTSDQADKIVRAVLGQRRAERDALLKKLPPFDLEKALSGSPYIHIFDLPTKHCYRDIRMVAEPHSGYMVWVGEWLFYDSIGELETQLRMADASVLGMLEVQR